MKKENRTVLLVGIGILLLAVLIVLLSVFVPRARYKSIMREQIDLILAPDPAYITVTDPLFDNGDLLGRNGKEVALEGDAVRTVTESLSAIREAGFRYEGREQKLAGAWDLRLFVRTAAGESASLWLEAERFYYVTDGVAYFFAAKDPAAYATLYAYTVALLEVEA